ncbi:MAG: type II toxin-antitoxin system HicB family antitoxin [Oscillospiraceae bacterium]|jgi:predicted RNase H-like HicB family nuclease|nr:type II toxin-antitoxin system HicB family antitoxin [Oscillospiraceae bacterium]
MTAKEYMTLPYSVIFRHVTDESGDYYFASVQELDGCMSDGATWEEAQANIMEAMEGWIETRIEQGFPVPIPDEAEQYSGKYVVRLPKTLHRRLAAEAKKEGVSLNQYTVYKLSL